MRHSPGSLYAALAAATRSDVVIDASKTAEWLAARLQEDAAACGGARILLCTCDPLLAANTQRLRTGERVLDAVAAWHDQNATLVQVALAAGRPLLRVDFEDLRADTEGTLRRVCDFLGLDFEPRMANWASELGHAGGHHAESSYGDPRPLVTATDPAHERALAHWLGRDSVPTLHVSEVREAAQALSATLVTALLGYAIELPARRADSDPEELERDRAWAKAEVALAQGSLLRGDSAAALDTLALQFEWFGPAFDDLGLDLQYESIGAVLFDLLSREGLPEQALLVARTVLAARPDSPVILPLLAGSLAANGDTAGARDMLVTLLEHSPADALDSAALAGPVATVLAATPPDDAAFAPLLAAVAQHATLLAAASNALGALHPSATGEPSPEHAVPEPAAAH
jgi:hypothetical protein